MLGHLALVLVLATGSEASGAPPLDPRMDVDLSPPLELLCALDALAAPDPFAVDAEHGALVLRHLGALRSHPAVKLEAGTPDAFNISLRHETLTRIRLGAWEEAEPFWVRRVHEAAGGEERWRAWRDALAAFSETPEFGRFLAERRALMKPSLDRLEAAARERRYLRKFEEFSGMEFRGRHRLRRSPYEPGHWASVFGLVLRRRDGTVDLMNAVPVWYDGEPDPRLVWHEVGHAVLDVLADLHGEELDSAAGAKDDTALGCSGTWKSCVQEHVNDAVAAYLASGADVGFVSGAQGGVQRALVAELEAYDVSRRLGASLIDVYPKLVRALGSSPAAAPGRDAGDLQTALAWSDAERARALKTLDRVLARRPSPRRRVLAAMLSALSGDFVRCERDARAALRAAPDDPAAAFLLSAALRRAGRAKEADAVLEKGRRACASPPPREACWMQWPRELVPSPGDEALPGGRPPQPPSSPNTARP